MTAPGDLQARLDAAPMSRTQIVGVLAVGALCALDGFDVLAAAFAAPGIARTFGLSKGALGSVLSSGLVGMALGAFLVAPFADRFGRRPMIIAMLALMGVGMALAAFASSLVWLIGWRVLTGIGIGAMIAIIVPLGAEYSNARRRPLAIAVMAVGYPIGGTVGGAVSAVLLQHYGWPSIFLFGAAAAIVMLPLALLAVPEPLAFLLTRRDPGALARVNGLLERCSQPPVDALPPVAARTSSSYAAIMRASQRAATLRVTIINLLLVMAVYFFLSWTPQMIAEAGFSASVGTTVSALGNLSGVAGGLITGALAARWGLRGVAATAMGLLGVGIAVFGATPPQFALLLAAAIVTGFFVNGAMAGMYTIIAATFPAEARATGTGFVTGVGRAGSAVAPALAGALFGGGFTRTAVCLVFAGFAIAAALLSLTHRSGAPSRYE